MGAEGSAVGDVEGSLEGLRVGSRVGVSVDPSSLSSPSVDSVGEIVGL